MAAIELRQVSKFYGPGPAAVADATLEVRDGEFMILLGPSGCGKSTTLRMIAGLESVSSGEVRIGGKRVNELAPRDRNIAVVFQSYALYPHMTVGENLAFGLKMHKLAKPEIEKRVAEVAAMLGIATQPIPAWIAPASPPRSRAGSASGSPSAGPSCASPPPSCSTSRSPISMPGFAPICASSW